MKFYSSAENFTQALLVTNITSDDDDDDDNDDDDNDGDDDGEDNGYPAYSHQS